jgi:hypothetical protein
VLATGADATDTELKDELEDEASATAPRAIERQTSASR